MIPDAESAKRQSTLVIGAGSYIAQAIIERLLSQDGSEVIAVSRTAVPTALDAVTRPLTWIQSDYTEASIAEVCTGLKTYRGRITRVIICNGVLHDQTVRPEKRLEDLGAESMTAVFAINTVLPMLWLRGLMAVINGGQPCVVTVFSARVGSIEDNARGGWYSYRASKAALNMLLKSAAIELARRAPQVKLIAFHPGTVDTPLSRPFQASVPEGKLFTSEFVADRLLQIMDGAVSDGDLTFVDWDGKPIPW